MDSSTTIVRLRDHPREYGENQAGVERDEIAVDHPREYGENLIRMKCGPSSMGSSPRIRGKCAVVPALRINAVGIIPANTGKIFAVAPPCLARRDHPREYGENRGKFFMIKEPMGSSPRIRGKSTHRQHTTSGHGIIPANTGKIMGFRYGRLHVGDHPREYGENEMDRVMEFESRGIIPANTGKIRYAPRART